MNLFFDEQGCNHGFSVKMRCAAQINAVHLPHIHFYLCIYMKQLTLFLAFIAPLLALLAACSKPKAAQVPTEGTTDSLTDTIVVDEAPKDTVPWLDTAPIRMNLEKNDRFYCAIEVDYPQGEDAFSKAVRHYVVSQLNANRPIIGENKYAYKSYVGDVNDGKQVVDYFCKNTYAYILSQKKEEPEMLGCNTTLKISRLAETDRYVVYETETEEYFGGAHGATGIKVNNIIKPLGRILKYPVMKSAVKKLQPALRKGVKRFFKEISSDWTVNDLFIENNLIPLPDASPYLAKDGVHFVYQEYEIGPYVMGSISFTIPYDEIMPYLTTEAREVVGVE